MWHGGRGQLLLVSHPSQLSASPNSGERHTAGGEGGGALVISVAAIFTKHATYIQ